MPTSIFSDEWRECLIAHYTYILRASDQRTERTLRGVMLDVGFTEDDLRNIYLAATTHVDDVPPDFTPDTQFIASVVMPAVSAAAPAAPLIDAPFIADSSIDESSVDDSSVDDVPFDTSFDDTDSQELLALDESEILDESELEDEDDALALPTDESEDDEPPPADPDATQLSLF